MNYAYKGVEVVIGESNLDVRRGVRSSLLSNGFSAVFDFNTVEEAREHVRGSSPDLIVIDKDLPIDGACGLVSDIRNERLGNDPFMPVILTAGAITGDNVHSVLSSGVDYIVQRPFAVGDLLARVRDLIENRKPFVVTQTYIGPDRRPKERSSGEKDQLIDVPNTLRAKANDDRTELAAITQARKDTMSAVNTMRLQRHAVAIMSKIEEVVTALSQDRESEAYTNLEELAQMMSDIRRRIGTTKYAPSAPVCDSLITKLKVIREHQHVQKNDAAMLWPLAETIAATFAA